MKLNLEDYQGVQKQLLTPFRPEDVSQIDGFSYVDPYHYRARLALAFPNGYDLTIDSFTVDRDLNAIYGLATIEVKPEHGYGYAAKKTVLFSESFTKASDTDKVIQVDMTFSKANSAALKAICRELGLGLDLYYKESKNGSKKGGQQPAPAQNGSTQGSSAPTSNGTWDGTKVIGFGTKWKGKAWSEPDTGFLNWLIENSNSDSIKADAQAELARRASTNVAAGQAAGAAAAAEIDDEEIPF